MHVDHWIAWLGWQGRNRRKAILRSTPIKLLSKTYRSFSCESSICKTSCFGSTSMAADAHRVAAAGTDQVREGRDAITVMTARTGRPTTRSKWQRESVASSSVAIESRAGDRHGREPTTALAVPGWGSTGVYRSLSRYLRLRLCPRGDPQNQKLRSQNLR